MTNDEMEWRVRGGALLDAVSEINAVDGLRELEVDAMSGEETLSRALERMVNEYKNGAFRIGAHAWYGDEIGGDVVRAVLKAAVEGAFRAGYATAVESAHDRLCRLFHAVASEGTRADDEGDADER